MIIHGLADDNVVAAHTLRLSSALLAAGRPHTVLPLSGVTHMTPQEVVAENLKLLQVQFLERPPRRWSARGQSLRRFGTSGRVGGSSGTRSSPGSQPPYTSTISTTRSSNGSTSSTHARSSQSSSPANASRLSDVA